MKWINAEQQVTVTIYDEEHEEHLAKTMTVEEMLDTYTNEGCPTIYTNPQPETAHWILLDECANSGYYCSNCHKKVVKEGWSSTVKKIKFCPNCGLPIE